jgi:2-deoxy-D-gluconate 3-dehydrogenase
MSEAAHSSTPQIALVTGASRGIGAAIALELARHGMRVVGTATSAAGAGHISAALSAFPGCRGEVLDVTDGPAGEALINAITQAEGSLHVLVNNAGITRDTLLMRMKDADWDAVIDTNLKVLFFLSQAAARHMAERGSGKIINIASLLTFQGGIRVPSYAAAKSGVGGVTKAMANELAPKGVQVNAIAPGYISTNNTAALQSDETRNRQILERIPSGRWGKPEDIAGAAVFLAAPASDYVTGQILAVDGGWLAR